MSTKDPVKELAKRSAEAAQRASDRAKVARWDLNVVIFMFAILAIIIIMISEGFETEVVAPVGALGFLICWLVGWRRGQQLYTRFYEEEWSREKELHDLLYGKSQSSGENKEEGQDI
ncbi:hypothetical protein ACFLTS_04410 [Chloroflexota bacterium]